MSRLIFLSIALAALVLGVTQLGGVSPASAHHTGNTYDCANFPNQAAAQAHYAAHPGDQDNLDADKDGTACENILPCPCVGSYYGGSYYGSGNAILLPTTPTHLSLVVSPTTIPCNGQASVTARLLLPNGGGAPSHLVIFTSTAGTVFTNIMTDAAGYVSTVYTAPFNSGQVTVTAHFGGLSRSQIINVDCPRKPDAPMTKPPLFVPPSTGDAGLVAAGNNGSVNYVVVGGGALLSLGAGAGVFALARQRR